MRDGTYRGPAEQPFISGIVFDGTTTEPFSTSFLIDTGADSTVLSGEDAARSGFTVQETDENGEHIEAFPEEVDVVAGASEGVGGQSKIYIVQEPIQIGFVEHDDNGEPTHVQYELLDHIQIAPMYQ